jgi:branched-chain amino acid transport system permease protein
MLTLPSWDWFLALLAAYGIFLIVSLSLNLEYGYAGIPNFGKALPVAGGAFVVGALAGRLTAWAYNVGTDLDFVANNAVLVQELNRSIEANMLPALGVFILTLVLATGVGAVLGALAVLPSLRLKEEYSFAITLLAMAEVTRVVGQNYTPMIGGSVGVGIPDFFAWLGPYRYTVMTVVIVLVAIGVFFFVGSLTGSPVGRMLRAIRDNEIAAAAAGKDIMRVKLKTLIISSAIAGIAGALYVNYAQNALANTYDKTTWTFWSWEMVMVGGASNNKGTAIGTLLFIAVQRLITFYKTAAEGLVPFDITWLEFIALGVLLLCFLIFKPQGMVPERPTATIDFQEFKTGPKTLTAGVRASKRDRG